MNFLDTIFIGINSGFLFIPFAIGIGLIYKNLREIDVSIDGVVVIAGIVAGYTWNISHSYTLSISSGLLTGFSLSSFVAFIQAYLKVPSLMAGLVFSLLAHTLSIFWVGESISLKDTSLIPSVSSTISIQFWHIAIIALCYILPIYAYNSHIGLSIRKYGSGIFSNLRYSHARLRLTAYGISGSIYGVGAAIYVHSRGTATSGASFDFLVHALTAVLLVSRLLPKISEGVKKGAAKFGVGHLPEWLDNVRRWISFVASYEALSAPLGAIVLEIISAIVISYTVFAPNMWKLVLSIVLLLVLSQKPSRLHFWPSAKSVVKLINGIAISGMKFAFYYPGGTKGIFDSVDVHFSTGLNILSGANGSGKTTLLKVISGELSPERGSIIHDKKDITGLPTYMRPIFMLMQNPMETLVPDMTVAQNLFLAWQGAKAFTLNKADLTLNKIMDQLKQTKLNLFSNDDPKIWSRPISALSGGQAYCVAVYAAVLSGQSIILADEPTTGLDETNYNMVRDAMGYFSEMKDCTVLIVTHDERLKDLSWNKYRIGDSSIVAESNWWDARHKDSFFSTVYRVGDDSSEGFLNGKPLDLFERTNREVVLIEEICGSIEGKRILDCPCGYGRHSFELAKRGAVVVGVDISPPFICEAKKRSSLGLRTSLRPLFEEGDMRHLPSDLEDASFDVCINMFLAFGFFDDKGDIDTLLEFCRILKPGGKLLIYTDVNPDNIAAGKFGDPTIRNLLDGTTLKITECYNSDNKRLEGSWSLLEDSRVKKSQNYSIRIYSHQELLKMVKDCGFEKFEIFYPKDSGLQDLFYIATK